MIDAIVVGAGITGATCARLLKARGMDVLTLDDGRPLAGTGPSGGHLRPTWFRGMPKDQYLPAMGLLDEAWGMLREEYELTAGGTTVMYRVDTDVVLRHPRTMETVTRVGMLHNYPEVVTAEAGPRRCRLLVLAAGAWAAELAGGLPPVQAKRGVSFRVPGVLPRRIIHQWAPYKQVVSHQQTAGEFWVGDGTAILAKNWDDDRTRACLDRCASALGLPPWPVAAGRHGLRPYCEPACQTDPCLVRRLGPRAWCVTGAGKSGTIAAGWAAGKILAAL